MNHILLQKALHLFASHLHSLPDEGDYAVGPMKVKFVDGKVDQFLWVTEEDTRRWADRFFDTHSEQLLASTSPNKFAARVVYQAMMHAAFLTENQTKTPAVLREAAIILFGEAAVDAALASLRGVTTIPNYSDNTDHYTDQGLPKEPSLPYASSPATQLDADLESSGLLSCVTCGAPAKDTCNRLQPHEIDGLHIVREALLFSQKLAESRVETLNNMLKGIGPDLHKEANNNLFKIKTALVVVDALILLDNSSAADPQKDSAAPPTSQL